MSNYGLVREAGKLSEGNKFNAKDFIEETNKIYGENKPPKTNKHDFIEETNKIYGKSSPSGLENAVGGAGRAVASAVGDVANLAKLPAYGAEEGIKYLLRKQPFSLSGKLKEYSEEPSLLGTDVREKLEHAYDTATKHVTGHEYKPEGPWTNALYEGATALTPLGVAAKAGKALQKSPKIVKAIFNPTKSNVAATAAAGATHGYLSETHPENTIGNALLSMGAGVAAGTPFKSYDQAKKVYGHLLEHLTPEQADHVMKQYKGEGLKIAKGIAGNKIEAAIRHKPFYNYLEETLPDIFGLNHFKEHDVKEIGKAALRSSENYLKKYDVHVDKELSKLNELHNLDSNEASVLEPIRYILNTALKKGSLEDIAKFEKGRVGEELSALLSAGEKSTVKASRLEKPLKTHYHGTPSPYNLMNLARQLIGHEPSLNLLEKLHINPSDLPKKYGRFSAEKAGKEYKSFFEPEKANLSLRNIWEKRKSLDKLIGEAGWDQIGGNKEQLKMIRGIYNNILNQHFESANKEASKYWKKFNKEHSRHAKEHVPWITGLRSKEGADTELFNEVYKDLKGSGQYVRYLLENADAEDAKKLAERAIYDLSNNKGKTSLGQFHKNWNDLNKDVKDTLLKYLEPEQAKKLQKGNDVYAEIAKIRGESPGFNQGLYNVTALSWPQRVFKSVASHVAQSGLKTEEGKEKTLRHLLNRSKEAQKSQNVLSEDILSRLRKAKEGVLERAELPKPKIDEMALNRLHWKRLQPVTNSIYHDSHNEKE